MKATELRIGNLIQDKKGNTQVVEQILDSGMISQLNGARPDDFEPIPLTEQWLVKMGFEKRIHTEYRDGFEYYSKNGHEYSHGYWVVTTHLSKYYLSLEVDGREVSIPNEGIEYVHQLQNTYRWVVGDELTISTPVK